MCGSQVASDFYPVSISCGYRVSCAETLLVDGVSRQVGGASPGRAGEPGSRAGEPDFLAMSELFAGKVHHI